VCVWLVLCTEKGFGEGGSSLCGCPIYSVERGDREELFSFVLRGADAVRFSDYGLS